MNESRRQFLKTTAAATALSQSRVLGANDRVRIAGLGTGGRGRYILEQAVRVGGVEIVALCDVYEPRRLEASEKLAPQARMYVDYREVLDRKDIDGVVIGAPDHWHTPMTMDAVRAGKDVYVEKPVTHNIPEGEELIKTVRATKQLVQVGYQQRSWEHFILGQEMVRSGKLGKVSMVLASWYQNYLRNMQLTTKVDTAKLDWKGFLGNAPERTFDPYRFLRWRMFWDYGGGHLTDLYSHFCDVIHWYMASDTPASVSATGGIYFLDYPECPDTITAAYDYKSFGVTYTGTLNGSLDGGTIWLRGSRALMKVTRDGFAVYPEGVIPTEKTHYPEPAIEMRSQADGARAHVANWLDCIRSRKEPNCPVEPAVAAARAAHLGNMAYRKGATVKWPLG
ncbi:MAG: Gfo/Idh/MocA family oxidoreductase [Acidobacteria bacterium]|nr:Gfo/Idh/MocA family oxidoreductase [Acidobacteriota bacterium]